MNKRLATPTKHLSESLKNLQGTKKWSDLNSKGMEDVLFCLNLKEDIWLPYLKIVFSFLEIISSLEDMSMRESSDISSSDHDSDWVFSVSNQNKNPTKVLCTLTKGPICSSQTKTAEQVRCYWRSILFQVLDTVAIDKVLPKQDFALCQQFNV